jgi:membrane protein
MKLTDVWPLVKKTGTQFWRHRGPRLGAALAFYMALSLSPLLLIVVAIAGAAFGEPAARGEIAHQLQDTVGDEGARAIQAMLANHKSQSQSVLMSVIGFATLVVGASGVFGQLQEALDTIWDVRPEQVKGGLWALVKDRLLAFSVVGGLALLLLVSLILTAVISGLSKWLDDRIPIGGWGLQLANQVLSFLLTAVLFAFIFKVLPHARPSWADVRVGALITAALFTLGKYLIGLYLGQAAPGSAYGTAGSFVVLLVWIYYSTQILLFGAEFTQVYANTHGTGLNRDLRDENGKCPPPASTPNRGSVVATN